jgi:hypothetical protein
MAAHPINQPYYPNVTSHARDDRHVFCSSAHRIAPTARNNVFIASSKAFFAGTPSTYSFFFFGLDLGKDKFSCCDVTAAA